jgi:hypothetical protein
MEWYCHPRLLPDFHDPENRRVREVLTLGPGQGHFEAAGEVIVIGQMETKARSEAKVRVQRAAVVHGGEAIDGEVGDEVAQQDVVRGPVLADGQVVVDRRTRARVGGGDRGK